MHNNLHFTNQQELIAHMRRAITTIKSLGPGSKLPSIQVSSLCEGRPHMQLAPQGIGPGMVYVSDKTRREMNEWLREFFGETPSFVVQATDRVTGEVTVFMSQRDYDKVKMAWEAA